MKNIKIFWQKLDNHGSVRSTYRGIDGKLHVPMHVGVLWADIRPITKFNNPGNHFDLEAAGAVYSIGGEHYVVEGCFSRVFKPLSSVLKALADRRPFVGPARGGLANRSEVIPLD